MTGEIRQNRATGQWVIHAVDRGERPSEFTEVRRTPVEDRSVYAPDCPFCPGNEANLTSIVAELGTTHDYDWQTRIIPNKFPALTPNKSEKRRVEGVFISMPATGQHEVIIETPYHNRDLQVMALDEVHCLIETYHRRYVDLLAAAPEMRVIIFRNHGPHAGTSLVHPHSQLIMTAVVPRQNQWRELEAERYFNRYGENVFAAMLAAELRDGKRIVGQNESFVAFVPYAAEVPFEMWVMPHTQQASFGQITDNQKHDLAEILVEVLRRMSVALDDPDYNYVIQTAAQYQAGVPYLRWYLQIRPRLTTPAGFEVGSGMVINPSLPEEDAALLNQTEI